MDSQTSESLQPQLALRIRRSKLKSCDFNSISVALSLVSSLGLSAFTLTGCSGSFGHSALAETGGKQAQLLSSRGTEGSAANSSANPDSSVSSDDNPGAIPGVSSGGSPGSISGTSPGSSSGFSSGSSSDSDSGASSPPYAGSDSGAAMPGAADSSGSFNSSGASSSSGTSSSSGDDTVVSSGPLGDHHEWTQEEMLLARPMPMSQEERDFAFKNKAPESIRTWTLGEFQDFTKTAMGRSQMLQEGRRWVAIRTTLKQQLVLGQDFLAGAGHSKSKKGRSKISQPGQNGASGDGEVKEIIPEFLSDEGVFEGAESATTFDRLKECRQDITDLCRSIDGVKKTASKRGRLEALEQYMSSQ